jgi:hypothetical protein
MASSRLLRFMRFYPPFIGAGIRIAHMTDDMREVVVEMKLHWWNANYVKTHYGGSLYSMADPFYMLMLLENLGRGYIVWDKAATIRFRKPGKGTVRAEFRLSQEQIDSLRAQADAQEKVEPTFTVQVRDAAGEVVAEVEKLLYIRRKER